MNDTLDQNEHVEEMVRKLLDGAITAEEHAELEGLLEIDADARRLYTEYMALHALLHWDQSNTASRPIALEPPRAVEVGAASRCDEDADVVGRIDGNAGGNAGNSLRRFAIAATLLIGVALGIGFLSQIARNTPIEPAPAGPSVALLIDHSDATWAEDSVIHEASMPGSAVPNGTIRLASGSAQVMLGSGSALTLQGPTEMHVTGNNRGMLTRGRVTVSVPPQATGTTIDAPGGVSVVDLGTRFSMSVDEWGRVEVFVIEGEVEIQTNPESGRAKNIRLTAGRAVWVLEDRVMPIALTNVALGKPATQSTTLHPYVADNAVDGNYGSITHTQGGWKRASDATPDRDASWRVDLGKDHAIRVIDVYNRSGCCGVRLRDITVEVLADDGETVVYRSPLLNPENELKSPAKLTVVPVDDLGGGVTGRYVRVSRTGDPDLSGNPTPGKMDSGHADDDRFVLSLGEVEVHGYATQP